MVEILQKSWGDSSVFGAVKRFRQLATSTSAPICNSFNLQEKKSGEDTVKIMR